MSSNEEKIKSNYKNAIIEDGRFLHSKATEMESHYTKKFISDYVSLETTVIELGCGTGHYGMYLADKCKSYLGIDITPEHLEAFNNKINENNLSNVQVQLGDATNLINISDNSFDVVLVLGPMYHLPPEERDLVFKESKRICKYNGIIIYAYINKVGAYLMGSFLFPDVYPNKKCSEFIFEKGVDDIRSEVFFYTMPEEMEEMASKHNLSIIKNVGINFSFCTNIINSMPEERIEEWMKLSDYMSNTPSCTGVSTHTLLICKNNNK